MTVQHLLLQFRFTWKKGLHSLLEICGIETGYIILCVKIELQWLDYYSQNINLEAHLKHDGSLTCNCKNDVFLPFCYSALVRKHFLKHFKNLPVKRSFKVQLLQLISMSDAMPLDAQLF